MMKLFCKHEWEVHSKEKYEWDETVFVDGTENWIFPKLEKRHFQKQKKF